jgi:sulfate/thiosulfate transport system permease protein
MILAVQRSAIPGFAPALGVTLLWLSLIVLVPLAALVLRPWELGLEGVWRSITEPRVLASLRLSFGTAALAAAVNVPFGLLVAWVMVRYRFPGRNLADSLIDMPLALPTAVAGIALTALCFRQRAGSEGCWRPWASRSPTRHWASSSRLFS